MTFVVIGVPNSRILTFPIINPEDSSEGRKLSRFRRAIQLQRVRYAHGRVNEFWFITQGNEVKVPPGKKVEKCKDIDDMLTRIGMNLSGYKKEIGL